MGDGNSGDGMGRFGAGLVVVRGGGSDRLLNGELARTFENGDPATKKVVVADLQGELAPTISFSPLLSFPFLRGDSAPAAVGWLADEAARRSVLLASKGAADIGEYNALCPRDPIPYLSAFLYGWDNDAMSRAKVRSALGRPAESAAAALGRLSGCGALGMGVAVGVRGGRAGDVLGKRTLALADLVVDCGDDGRAVGGAPFAGPIGPAEALAAVDASSSRPEMAGYNVLACDIELCPYIDPEGAPAKAERPAHRQLSFSLPEADYERFCRLAGESGLSKVDYLMRIVRRDELQRGGESGMHALTVSVDGKEAVTAYFRGDPSAVGGLLGRRARVGDFFVAMQEAGVLDGEAVPWSLLLAAFGDWRRRCGYAACELSAGQLADEADCWMANVGFRPAAEMTRRPSDLDDMGVLARAAIEDLAGGPGCDGVREWMRADEPTWSYWRRGALERL